jgi:F-type H+-transporting ATPase subunit b
MGGFASLGVNLPLLVVFVINFIVLFVLLRLFLYKPVLKMLDERAKRTAEAMEQAEATKKEYEQARVEVQKQIEKGRQEGQAFIAQAMQVGERLKEETRQEAQKQAQVIVDRTRTELEAERDKIVGDLRREFVDISISAAEKVIKETLDKEKHRKLIEETLRESVTFKKSKPR